MCGKCRESDLLMKIKTCELSGAALDWAVAKCIANVHEDAMLNGTTMTGWWISNLFIDPNHWVRSDEFNPSTNWAQAGPLIEENCITVVCAEGEYSSRLRGYKTYWVAEIGKHCAETVYWSQGDDWGEHYQISCLSIEGDAPLIAAMRCLVQVKLGDEVEIPDQILEN